MKFVFLYQNKMVGYFSQEADATVAWNSYKAMYTWADSDMSIQQMSYEALMVLPRLVIS